MKQNTAPSQMTLTVEELVFINEQVEYFDTHDIGDELEEMPEVHFEISPQARSRFYFEVEPELRAKLKAVAKQRGISPETLLNEWVREKTAKTEAVGAAK